MIILKENIMKKIVIVLLFFVSMNFACTSQKNINKVVYSKKVGEKILVGKINRQGLEKAPFRTWFEAGYNSYKPDSSVINEIKKHIAKNAKIVIIMGTWCPDSRREVPRFYKILDEIGFNKDNLTVYAVDRNFKAGNIDLTKYDVKRIPTIIFYHYGYPAGRIVERPYSGSLEKDLLEFTKRK